MKSTVEDKMTKVKNKIDTKWNEAQSFLKNIDLASRGKNIVLGLISGVGDIFGNVRRKIEALAGLI
ncbi:hypothetical protein, partial [Lysinibacillus sp. D4B2_S17]|uniref:hypothetical protein n=1 Tax=Lysinibacillus sp. D4B2_S17 TaxID=2941225 RepID=UPI0020C0EB75